MGQLPDNVLPDETAAQPGFFAVGSAIYLFSDILFGSPVVWLWRWFVTNGSRWPHDCCAFPAATLGSAPATVLLTPTRDGMRHGASSPSPIPPWLYADMYSVVRRHYAAAFALPPLFWMSGVRGCSLPRLAAWHCRLRCHFHSGVVQAFRCHATACLQNNGASSGNYRLITPVYYPGAGHWFITTSPVSCSSWLRMPG